MFPRRPGPWMGVPVQALIPLVCLAVACAEPVAAPSLDPPESPIAGAGGPEEARQFDFWVGEWDVNLRVRQEDGSWPDRGKARAKVFPVLEGKGVLELWDSEPIKGFSLRYFDPVVGKWVLWLAWPGQDRAGSSGLTGSFRHGRGEFFSTTPRPDGSEVLSRFTFSDISADRLRWDDAFSDDGGKTWKHGWIMEFSRTADASELPAEGGAAHTWHDGSRCTLDGFGRFDRLIGRRSGEIRRQGAEAVPAELVAWRILDGCAVLARVTSEREGHPFESLHLLTYNTVAGQIEESVLDSAPESALEVFFGDDSEGTLELERGGLFGIEDLRPDAVGTRRRVWRFEGGDIAFEILDAVDGTWGETESAVFPSAD